MPLIPEIVIGGKYRWKSSPIELLCPHCGANLGMGPDGAEFDHIVTILSAAEAYAKENRPVPKCDSCLVSVEGSLEGWFHCIDEEGQKWAVPYTQLSELQA